MCLTVNTSISCLLFLSKLINAFDLHIEKFNRRLFVVIYEKILILICFALINLDHLRLSDSTAASDGCTVSRDIASHFWFVLAFFILHIKCIGAGEGREVGVKQAYDLLNQFSFESSWMSEFLTPKGRENICK